MLIQLAGGVSTRAIPSPLASPQSPPSLIVSFKLVLLLSFGVPISLDSTVSYVFAHCTSLSLSKIVFLRFGTSIWLSQVAIGVRENYTCCCMVVEKKGLFLTLLLTGLSG